MEVLRALEGHGLLYLQDARRPSVATIVAGAPVKGSWWGHRAGHAIFAVCEALEEACLISIGFPSINSMWSILRVLYVYLLSNNNLFNNLLNN